MFDKTPLKSALDSIVSSKRIRFYMPGHKGRLPEPFKEIAEYDVTEIPGADNLYEPTEAIAYLEKIIAAAYCAKASLISTSGSTLCIQAMLMLARRRGKQIIAARNIHRSAVNAMGLLGIKASLISTSGSTLCIQAMLMLARRRGKQIIAARNIHRSAVNAMGLLGMEPIWLRQVMSKGDDCSIDGIALQPSVRQIEKVLSQKSEVAAVYITSPDYYGQVADVAAISEVCEKYGAWLIVDNAHGAHLGKLGAKMHPIQLGATMCCDSLHKSMPVLTGAAVLHLNDVGMYDAAKYAMSVFGTTSPSYPIMLSIDRISNNLYGIDEKMVALGDWITNLKSELIEYGFETIRRFMVDPVKLAVGFRRLGHTAESFEKYMRQWLIDPEYISDGVAVFMLSTLNTDNELNNLSAALLNIPVGEPLRFVEEIYKLPNQVLPIGEAMFRPYAIVPVDRAVGRVSARMISKCPPGVPMLMPGEEITEEMCVRLQQAKISNVFVIK